MHVDTIMSLRATGFILICIIYSIAASSPCSSQSSAAYELIYRTDSTTDLTGSITLSCRDDSTAEEVGISEISFFLNCSSGANNCLSLRERGDITVVAVTSTRIRFNLTREYDGNYTCGKRRRSRGDGTCTANYTMSPPEALVCKWI